MKPALRNTLGLFVLISALAAGCATATSSTISRADAERAALAKVPNGVVKEGELEKEHGRLIWSFDIATPDSKDITAVHVDANTGDVVAVDHETAEQENAEKDGKK
jgi:uncharacterized membrane protein YkoI